MQLFPGLNQGKKTRNLRFITDHAHCLLHLSVSQHRIALALENPLALMQKLFAVNFARL
jgi:hypothetical protein